MNYIQPTAYILKVSTDNLHQFNNIEEKVSKPFAHISDLSCAEQERKELLHALNSLLTAVQSDLNIPQTQQVLYLQNIAIPRATAVITKYGK